MKAVLAVGSNLSVAKMQRSLEQRYAIKFCVLLNKTFTETHGLLKGDYGDQVLSRAQVNVWHRAFKEGREDAEDEQRPGRPSTTPTEKDVSRVREFLNIDRRASLREISEELNLTYYNVREIVTEKLAMRKLCAKMVPGFCLMSKSTTFLCTSLRAKMGVSVLPHSPYSQEVSPPDFFLFPLVKRKLKGRRSDSIKAIQKAVTAWRRRKKFNKTAFKKKVLLLFNRTL